MPATFRQCVYKRRNRRYRWQGARDAAVCVAQVFWRRRGGERLIALLTTTQGVIRVHRTNAVGVLDMAEFPTDHRHAAMAFAYAGSGDRSPQLSLFQGVL